MTKNKKIKLLLEIEFSPLDYEGLLDRGLICDESEEADLSNGYVKELSGDYLNSITPWDVRELVTDFLSIEEIQEEMLAGSEIYANVANIVATME